MGRNVILKFRVTEDEAKQVRANAEKSEMKLSRYLREISLDGEIKVYDLKSINELALQVYRIGVNINQIAAMVNQTKTVYKNDMEKILGEFAEVRRTVEKFMKQFERDNKNVLEKK